MELLLIIAEGVLWVVDVIAMSADVYSWFKGRGNRIERREARQAGVEVPPRDRWNRRVIALTIVVAVSTAALLLWKA